ncbi:hypothetical protein TGP89_226680 [Toxoplasma gondii p89]|uniref:Transmembrane protein n=1 Tax=Toxoplasma gondii p89 TaxID=943119 RepID=A0A086KDZ3_TOXGO|nr:hypothetical protein TGP89_226680 [Toxoplasma gondii p89]
MHWKDSTFYTGVFLASLLASAVGSFAPPFSSPFAATDCETLPLSMATLAASSAAGPPSSRLTSVHHYEGDSPPAGHAIYEKNELSAALSPSGFADHSQTSFLPQEVASMAEAPHAPTSGHSRRVEKTESVASLLSGSPRGAVFLAPDVVGRRDERDSRREKRQVHAQAQEGTQVHGRHDAAGAGGSRYTGREREEASLYDDPAACASLYRRRQQAHHNLFDGAEGDDCSASITGSFRGKVARPELRMEDIEKGRRTREFEARRASDLSRQPPQPRDGAPQTGALSTGSR